MISIKPSKSRLVNAIFGCFFAILGLILPFFASTANVYADEDDVTRPTVVTTENNTDENKDENASTDSTDNTSTTEKEKKTTQTCDNSLGSLGWLVCPATGKISEAVDWLYDKNKEVLEINPVKAEEESPIYQIWNYFLGVANIAFVIFLLIAIYSQITGVGISNYGIKKALPKLIIAAIMVNLSFLICSILVDASNIIGAGLRGIFTSIEESTVPYFLGAEGAASAETNVAMTELYGALAGGTGLAVTAGFVAFEGGEIWMLIPAVLAALISVVVGLITIALRQVVVILLIMIAPLAIVAYIMPNTESLFKKWKNLLVRMLVFYPMYSLLFGASSLAGWAIIASAQDGFGLILGTAVKIFPLFFSWSLMKMSGTFLGTVNAKITGFFARPLAANRSWAESHRELTRQKNLASNNAYTPTLRLRQYLEDRKNIRELDTKEYAENVKNRGTYLATKQLYNKDGTPNREGERSYEIQAQNMRYKHYIDHHKNNMNKGLGQLEVVKNSQDYSMRARLNKLDIENMEAADALAAEQARGEKIDYDNAISRHERMQDALDAHMDDLNGYKMENGVKVPKQEYKFHFDKTSDAYRNAISNYNKMSEIMEGVPENTQYIMANAAQAYDTHKKIYEGKMQKLFDYTEPTQDLMNRLNELSKSTTAISNIDALIAGMRILNQRGDTDLVKKQLDQILEHGVELGTHASQSLASFLMFEVKDNDPFLRRFGKYINLETARVFNENKDHPEEMRKNMNVDYDEYVRGYHYEPDGQKMYAKKDMNKLVEGTSLDAVERTAFSNLDDSLKKAYGYDPENPNKEWDFEGYLKRRESVQTAMEPAFLSASLKWLSGSEQMNSAVKFWTGYELKQQKDENGDVLTEINEDGSKGDPIYDLKPVWEKGYTDEQKERLKSYYQRKTMQYFNDQTTGQILGMRTDYRDPTMVHLINEYLGNDEDRKREYNSTIRDLGNRVYDENDAKKNDKLKKKAIKDYKMKVAGKQLRQILGETGKLEQIYRTRRSGAANNAKDWLRGWVNLDDEETMAKEVKAYEEWRKANRNNDQDDSSGGDSIIDDNTIYDSGTRKGFRDELQTFYTDNQDMDPSDFYDECQDMLKNWFGDGPTVIGLQFEKFYNRQTKNGGHIDAYSIKQKLEDLLQDPSNYPDA